MVRLISKNTVKSMVEISTVATLRVHIEPRFISFKKQVTKIIHCGYFYKPMNCNSIAIYTALHNASSIVLTLHLALCFGPRNMYGRFDPHAGYFLNVFFCTL